MQSDSITSATENDILPTVRARKLLQRARIDFDLVRQQQRPRYAKFKFMIYDGGTTVYEARGYTIWKAHRIAGLRRGRAYYETGTAIDVTVPISSRALSYGEKGK
jgi:hypothetical protein